MVSYAYVCMYINFYQHSNYFIIVSHKHIYDWNMRMMFLYIYFLYTYITIVVVAISIVAGVLLPINHYSAGEWRPKSESQNIFNFIGHTVLHLMRPNDDHANERSTTSDRSSVTRAASCPPVRALNLSSFRLIE